MKRIIAALLAGFALISAKAFAGNGDLIVDGYIGIGTVAPTARLDVNGGIKFGNGSFGNTAVVSENDWLRDAWLTGQGATNIRWDNISKTWKRESNGDPATCYGYNDFGGILHHYNRLDFIKGECGSATEWTNADFLSEFTKLSISSTGNVGIGKSVSSSKLQIYPSLSNTAGVNIKLYEYAALGSTYASWSTIVGNNVMASQTAGINQMENIVTHPSYGGAAISLNGAGGIEFHTKPGAATAGAAFNSQRMIITPDGNVGIGTYPGSYTLNVAGTFYATSGPWGSSDIRFKKNVQHINDPLSKVLRLNGHSYEWKSEEYKEKNFPEGRHYGVIAHEIETVLPEVVNTAPDGSKAVAYSEIIPVLIEAIKEQQKIINSQQAELKGIKMLLEKVVR